MTNRNQASNPFTPEPLEADCQEFLETIAVLLATLGAPVLESTKPTSTASGEDGAVLQFRERGCEASGYQTPEGLLVLAGSKARPGVLGSATATVRKQRDALLVDGVVIADGQALVFQRDHLFSSPSAAGSFLVGGSNNGRESWRNHAGQSINQLEQLAIRSTTAREATD